MAVVGHRDPVGDRLLRESDHALAFRTLHASFVRRSYNAKVGRMQDARPL
jgi:hypothetical protein